MASADTPRMKVNLFHIGTVISEQNLSLTKSQLDVYRELKRYAVTGTFNAVYVGKFMLGDVICEYIEIPQVAMSYM